MDHILIKNKAGMEVIISPLGARIASIKLPVAGKLTEMTVVPDRIEQLEQDPFYLGATCGPVCNRITKAQFELNGCTYHLPKNDGDNCLHGGVQGVTGKVWQVSQQTNESVILSVQVGHIEDGFPGQRGFEVCYQLAEDNRLNILMSAVSDRDTPVNLTNHAYFNLGESSALPLKIKLAADKFLERYSNGLPTGELIASEEMGYDLNQWQTVADLIDFNKYPQMAAEQGVDHCFILNDRSSEQSCAQLRSDKTGIVLSVFSNQQAMQLYTGKFLGGEFSPYQGLCLESQGFTDAVNHSHFPSIVLKANERYQHNLVYQFTSF